MEAQRFRALHDGISVPILSPISCRFESFLNTHTSMTLQEITDQVWNAIIPELTKHNNAASYAIGAGATILGLMLGSLYSENESLLEFQKHVDKESYFQEMKELFLKRESFFKMLKISALGFFSIFIGLLVGVFYLTYNLFKLKKFIDIYFKVNTERIKNIEGVIESILKDHEVLDIKQFEFFKNEIEQQRSSFKDFITNRSLEFEATIFEAKNSCLKSKNSVHTDLKKITELVSRIEAVKSDITGLEEKLNNVSIKSSVFTTKLDTLSLEIKNKIENLKTESTKSYNDLDETLQNQKIELYKCNALLISSQILFDASISKFEQIESVDETNDHATTKRLIRCLEKATDLNEFLQTQEDIERKLLTTPDAIHDHSFNTLLFELTKRLSSVEEKLFNHNSLISSNDSKIKHLESSTSEKISGLKSYSDEWITSWVSVIYGLFNSSFMHLENQLFGVDCLEYTTIFDIAEDKIETNSKLLYTIMDKCKQTCLRIIKEINLLIFEYYLVQKSFANTSTSLISLCNLKIDDELNNLFLELETDVKSLTIIPQKKTEMFNTLMKLKYDLASDLKDDTEKFNELFRQNLEDFCIIHDTMKSLVNKPETKIEKDVIHEVSDDSVIELSERSNSIISLHGDSSFSESDNSIIVDSSTSSLRPFKLSANKTKSVF